MNVGWMMRAPTRLEQIAYKADMFPGELRDWLRAEVERRRGVDPPADDVRSQIGYSAAPTHPVSTHSTSATVKT